MRDKSGFLKSIEAEIHQESKTTAGRYFMNNFFRDFMRNKTVKIHHEEKSDVQKRFEKYLIEHNILINDYNRVVSDPKYFEVLSMVMMNSNKIDCLYSSYDLSFRSDSSIFYSTDIPKNSTEKQFKHIYDYLFVHIERPCVNGCNGDPYYYCIECGVYTCRECVNRTLRWFLMGSTDYGYIICGNCSKYNILYKLPARYDI